MAEYEVQYSVRVPSSSSSSGKVKYSNDAFPRKITVTANSPEEAKKAARSHSTIQRDLTRASSDGAPKPRLKFFDVKARGGGAMPNDPLMPSKQRGGTLPKRFAKGGLVKSNCGASMKPTQKSSKKK